MGCQVSIEVWISRYLGTSSCISFHHALCVGCWLNSELSEERPCCPGAVVLSKNIRRIEDVCKPSQPSGLAIREPLYYHTWWPLCNLFSQYPILSTIGQLLLFINDAQPTCSERWRSCCRGGRSARKVCMLRGITQSSWAVRRQ